MSYIERIDQAWQKEMLSPAEAARYARHLLLPSVGTRGQLMLKAARILVVGAGGLGCPVLQALAGAGVGRLTVMDPDRVDASNLARQWLHGPGDIGENKARSAAAALRELNPHIEIEAIPEAFVKGGKSAQMVAAHDLLIDATDALDARLALDQACAEHDRPWVHAALYRERFQTAVFWSRYRARYEDLFCGSGGAPDCAQAGVLGATAALAGGWQALEAIKLITGNGPVRPGELRSVHSLDHRVTSFQLPGAQPAQPIRADTPEVNSALWSQERARQALSIHEPVAWVDLREPESFAEGSLPGARNLQPDMILESPACLPSQTTTCLVCANGTVSALLATALQCIDEDRTVVSLEGGLDAFQG